METYFEQSIYAYQLINEVSKSLEINEAPAESVLNGNVEKIIRRCIQIIDENYEKKKIRELLKYYVAHSFFEDYDLESEINYMDEYIN